MTNTHLEPAPQKRIAIREADGGDADSACLVLRRSITELCKLDYGDTPGRLENWLANKTPDTFRAWLAEPDIAVLLAMKDEEVAGVGAAHRNGTVLLNYVHPDWRFKGVSSALLAAMEENARAEGTLELRLESTKTAERFYRARGYQTWRKADKAGLWLSKDL